MNEPVPIRNNVEPHNIDAEQQVLGALLLDASRVDAIGSSGADLFYDPCHADIFKEIKRRRKLEQFVSPVSLKLWADAHPGVRELGGAGYLVRLAGASVSSDQIADYATMLAEIKAKRDLLRALGRATIDLQDDVKSASEVAGQLEAALMSDDVAPSRSGPVSMMKATEAALRMASDAFQGGDDTRTHTGVRAVDKILGGMSPGELVLLAGRPSMGKTAVALSMALNVARDGGGVALASLEMTPDALAMRAISEATAKNHHGVSYSNILRGEFNESQFQDVMQASREVAELPIQILPQTYRDIGAMYAGAKQAKSLLGECGLKLFLVDYLQLMRADGRSRYEQITEISIALKALAMQLECPVIALSQLSRAVEQRDDKRPMLSDLRESGQLEQDADKVMFCYRDEYYLEREKPENPDDMDAQASWTDAMERCRNRLEIIVPKNRQGPVGTAKVKFNPALNLIWEDAYG